MKTRMLLSALGVLIALLAGAGALLFLAQDRLIYFPQRALDARPPDYGLAAEDLSIETHDGARLFGWWIRGSGETVFIFFHGNAGNVSHRLERVRALVAALGVDVVLVDYRGYGRSAGTPSENGLYADGEAIYRAVVARGIPPERIVLFGESLGCAVAIQTALANRCRAVVLEAPFLSAPEMARTVYPFLPSFLVRARFDNEEKVRRLAAPKLFVQAERDEVVPTDQTRRLFAAASPPKEYLVIPGARHNDMPETGGRTYLDSLRRFLDGVASAETDTHGRS
jgi:hypothetical protein